MIIDTSVLVAMIKHEPESAQFATAIRSSLPRYMSAASYLEAGIVIDREKNDALSLQIDEFIQLLDITFVPVSVFQVRIARAAYRAHGKDSGSKAKLNFGDCFTYALAMEMNEPLLFKGKDFNHTDVRIDERSVILS